MNSKDFAQTMKMYGGRRMCDFFQLNFVGLNYKTIKKVNKKVCNLDLVNMFIFKCVAKIYKETKQAHNISGLVLVILVEDETEVKSKSIISWDSKGDNLIGFCDAKENHCCVINFNHVIGIREVGYNNVLEAFTNNKIASFAIEGIGSESRPKDRVTLRITLFIMLEDHKPFTCPTLISTRI
jgi:hypothetical protein